MAGHGPPCMHAGGARRSPAIGKRWEEDQCIAPLRPHAQPAHRAVLEAGLSALVCRELSLAGQQRVGAGWELHGARSGPAQWKLRAQVGAGGVLQTIE